MDQILTTEFIWAVMLVGGVAGVLVLAKAPELLVAVLLVGPSYVQAVLWIVGYPVTRQQFAAAGGVIFIPLVLLFLVARMVQAGEREPIIGRPNLPFISVAIILGIWLLVGLAYSDSNFYGPRKTAEYFMFGLAPMFLGFVFLRDRVAVRRFLIWVVVVTAGSVLLTSAYTFVTQGTIFAQLTGWEPVGGARGIEIPGHLQLSSALVMSMAGLLALSSGRRSVRWKAVPVLVLPVVALYVMLAGTRSNLVSFLFVISVGFFFAYKGHRKPFVVALLVLAVTGALLVTYAPQEVRDRFFSSWVEEETQAGYGGYVRLQYLLHAPAHFVTAPIIGHGTGGWPLLERGLDVYIFPHNMFVEAAVENGLVGLGLVLALWALVIRRVWRILRTGEPGTGLYGIAVFGACLLAIESANALAHFGIAHGSCTLLLTSAITLRATFLEEETETLPEEEVGPDEATSLVRPVLKAGPLA
ncbi:MAG TPA: O-antigen ligase family protein [Planctomycetota bacterium]|nr:O-antigen ligase family protein [Planctomycetota bacterium]